MSLKELRRRISSVKSTQKITAAMKMVASAKLRRLQERVHFGSEYIERLNLIGSYLGKVSQDLEIVSPWLSAEGDRDLVIVFGAEKGLCGSFHNNLIRKINQVLEEHFNAQVVIFGAKAIDTLKDRYHTNLHFSANFKKPDMQTFLNLAKAIEPLKKSGEIGRIHIVGSAFKNILSQQVYSKFLCPFVFDSTQTTCDINIFEPSPDVFLPHFFIQYLSANLHQTWLETLTGEMASRMTAMDNATRNAKDMIDDLSLVYNRTRQAHITTQLIEIIAGSEGAKQ
jgi:F-type H+-transporting ATPase subunit gamma